MADCEHPKPILVSIWPDSLEPDQEPYESGEYVELEIIYDFNIHLTGHYCADCETLLDVSID